MLLIHSSEDQHSKYSHYLAEILRMEGFTDFVEAELASLTANELSGHDIVILPRLTTTMAQTEMLADYVNQGGKLIAFQPDDQLAQRMGMSPTHQSISAGYLHLSPEAELAGLCTEPVQVVVPATGWSTNENASVKVLASLLEARLGAGATPLPGVIHACAGQGEAVLFAYDLPHGIARLRQGDPALADICSSSEDGIYHASDLFADQLDERKLTLPQADIQTAMLSRLIETLAPKPRIWYYPEHYERIMRTLQYGPPCVHDGAHSADHLLFLTGSRAVRVTARGLKSRPEFPASNYNAAFIEFANGDRAKLEIGWFYPHLPSGEFELLGPLAFAYFDRTNREVVLMVGTVTERVKLDEDWFRSCFSIQLGKSISAVSCRSTPIPGTAEGIASLRLCKAIEAAMDGETPVSIGEG